MPPQSLANDNQDVVEEIVPHNGTKRLPTAYVLVWLEHPPPSKRVPMNRLKKTTDAEGTTEASEERMTLMKRKGVDAKRRLTLRNEWLLAGKREHWHFYFQPPPHG
jgi:hypothetical protein